MATATLSPSPYFQFFDDDGIELSNGKVYTYESGTSTPATTYTDAAMLVAHPNPIILDSAGRCTIYLPQAAFKFIVKTSADVTIRTTDPVSAVAPFDVTVDLTGVAGEPLTEGQVAYLSKGDGGLTAGRWYLTDSDNTYSSSTALIAMVVADIATGEEGSLRSLGRLTNLTGLSAGADYFVSATPGGITSTAPSNRRYVGRADSTTSLIIVANPQSQTNPSGTGTIETFLAGDQVWRTGFPLVCDGRMTLTTGVPVTTADVTGATIVYFTPYIGNRIALYNGTNWTLMAVAELSIAVPATTNQMYDLFVDYNAGTPALSLTAWTNDTTRATALTRQDGVYVLTGSTGKRYVGSCRTTGVSGQTEDSVLKRYVSNYYNRIPRQLRAIDTTNSWAYTTATIRQARATATNQVDAVIGVQEMMLDLQVFGLASNSAPDCSLLAGIGEDSTSALATGFTGGAGGQASGVVTYVNLTGSLKKAPAVGRHFYAWLEYSTATGTTTWYGGGGTFANNQSGLTGWIEG